MPGSAIEKIVARKVFDSRGNATIEVEVYTRGGCGIALAPSGASTGIHETVSYPNGGVDEGIELINYIIEPRFIGVDASETSTVDNLLHELDGTKDFSRLGGNVCLAVSMAAAKAAASSENTPFYAQLSGKKDTALPHPLGNVLGGGKHAGKNAPDIQEFLVLPVRAKSFFDMASANISVHKEVKSLLEKADPTFTGGKGDEGAWAPNLSNDKALDIVVRAADAVSAETGVEVRVGMDIASSSFWDGKSKKYVYERAGMRRSRSEQIDFILEMIRKYKLVYVEDPLDEEDFEGFAEITEKSKNCLICGDDLFTTNTDRLSRGIKLHACNAIIIKPNQIGTLSDTLKAVKMAKDAGYIPVASHRSGETCDSYLAHLAVGYECPVIKLGIVGGERLAKVNELLRIEESLGNKARVAKLSI
ncbi:phosphopyruvate hydratase [Candidatus Bathyarchaeota archaeon]|nr:phosphopyruvate hydratase [Candidatus Bathyarchaeota archaeon]